MPESNALAYYSKVGPLGQLSVIRAASSIDRHNNATGVQAGGGRGRGRGCGWGWGEGGVRVGVGVRVRVGVK